MFPDWAPAQGSLLVWYGPWGPWTGPGLGGARRINFTCFFSRILSKSRIWGRIHESDSGVGFRSLIQRSDSDESDSDEPDSEKSDSHRIQMSRIKMSRIQNRSRFRSDSDSLAQQGGIVSHLGCLLKSKGG